MLDLKQLDTFVTDADLRFQWGAEEYEVTYPLQAVLNLKRAHAESVQNKTPLGKEGETEDDAMLRLVAPLLGSKYDPASKKITGGLLRTLIDTHKDFNYVALGRLVTAVYAGVCWGDSVGEEYARTGDLGKALGIDALIKAMEENGLSGENQNPETRKDAGETGGDDSDEM